MNTSTKGKEVAEKRATEITTYGDMAGAGRDNIGADEQVIPFIVLLQGLSPELETMDGAKAGMMLNKGTQELTDGKEGFYYLPVDRQQQYVEWTPRKQGGGLIGRHAPESEIVKKAKHECAQRGEDPRFSVLWVGEPEAQGSHELRQTFYLFGFVLQKTEDGFEIVGQALVSFNGTKIKVYKHFMTVVDKLRGNPPLFALPVHITSVKEKNAEGEFYNYQIRAVGDSYNESLLPADNPLVQKGFEFFKQIRAEQVKMGEEGEAAAESGDVPF